MEGRKEKWIMLGVIMEEEEEEEESTSACSSSTACCGGSNTTDVQSSRFEAIRLINVEVCCVITNLLKFDGYFCDLLNYNTIRFQLRTLQNTSHII